MIIYSMLYKKTEAKGQNRFIWAGADTGFIQGVKGWCQKLEVTRRNTDISVWCEDTFNLAVWTQSDCSSNRGKNIQAVTLVFQIFKYMSLLSWNIQKSEWISLFSLDSFGNELMLFKYQPWNWFIIMFYKVVYALVRLLLFKHVFPPLYYRQLW